MNRISEISKEVDEMGKPDVPYYEKAELLLKEIEKLLWDCDVKNHYFQNLINLESKLHDLLSPF